MKSTDIYQALASKALDGMNQLIELPIEHKVLRIKHRLSRVRAVRQLLSELGLALPASSLAQAQLLAVFAPATRVRRRAKFG